MDVMWVLVSCLLLLHPAASSAQLLHEDAGGILDAAAGSQMSLEVEHSLDNGRSFTPRGTLLIHSLRSGASTMDTAAQVDSSLIKSLEQLCHSDGIYLLRFISSDGTVHRGGLHACVLLQSGLSDVIIVHLDWRLRIVAVSLAASDAKDDTSMPSAFKTKVMLQQMEAGPQPDTASFIQKLEQDKLAKQRGDNQDNRSFLAKYWIYIIPAVLVLAISSGGSDGGSGGQGG